VLLGQFQTDVLERRFDQYRKLSGCNYNVSVKQIIDSEKKLKVTSLLRLNSTKIHIKEIIMEINNSKEDDRPSDTFIHTYKYG
jgi:hypothetical protein